MIIALSKKVDLYKIHVTLTGFNYILDDLDTFIESLYELKYTNSVLGKKQQKLALYLFGRLHPDNQVKEIEKNIRLLFLTDNFIFLKDLEPKQITMLEKISVPIYDNKELDQMLAVLGDE